MELKFDTFVKNPSANWMPPARSRFAWSDAVFQAEWPPSRYTLALRFADLIVCTAVLRAALRAANVCWLRQVCRAIESVSRMMMTTWLPRPREKLLTHVWYWLRSGAPPALAPPQSRLVISYTEITGTWPAALAAPTKEEASCCTVEGLKLLN